MAKRSEHGVAYHIEALSYAVERFEKKESECFTYKKNKLVVSNPEKLRSAIDELILAINERKRRALEHLDKAGSDRRNAENESCANEFLREKKGQQEAVIKRASDLEADKTIE